MKYAILVVWLDGDQEYVKDGLSQDVATFTTKAKAQKKADFMARIGEDEARSISVVKYGKRKTA